MNLTKELSEAAVEINSLLDNVSQEVLDKIPDDFINYLRDIESFEYEFEYDTSKSLEEQNFSDTALEIIGLIYSKYICDEQERIEYEKEIIDLKNQIEIEKREKYNPNKIFEDKGNLQKNEDEQKSISDENKRVKENVSLVKVNESFLDKILKFFRKILKK